MTQAWTWIGFNAAVFALLVADLVLFHRRPREMKMREAVGWSLFWVTLGLTFTAFIYWHYGQHFDPAAAQAAAELKLKDEDLKLGALSARTATMLYIQGYALELSLSVDNLFVFLVIFNYFGVRGHLQHRVLFWGIVAAIALRAGLIFAGVALVEKFGWLLYVFGGFLLLTGVKLALEKGEEVDPGKNIVLRITRRFMPIAPGDHGKRFLVRVEGKLMATQLMVVLIVVNVTDVIFAVDSIPAVLGITKDPFLVYTSNFLAILGLRAMYFALAGMMGLFHFLRFGLAAVLVFIGGKMLAPLFGLPHIPTEISLAVVLTLLAVSVLASLVWVKEHGLVEGEPKKDEPPPGLR